MLDVIGAGFGRTGTASLKAALEHLGFGPCYHMFEVIARPERIFEWARAIDDESVCWDEVFDGYRASVDWPGAAFWRELTETYPSAKVILTVRDPQRWYDSTYNTIYRFSEQTRDSAGVLPVERGFSDRFSSTIDRIIWGGTFDGRFADREHAIEVFERHNAEVQRSVPAERLLVYRVGQGWQPLCEFLGVDVPDEDFPHVNEAASLPELAETVRREGRIPSPFTSPS
ncbi:hypothetical protein DFQ14_10226 [Halopolyspora algeriensis]|uniref:Sulfotransferase family protein n=1 Tax=Halopolyspora algeriensis TaxID=1500506 RepID=A0A368VV07_9ACTN|nr:sulfotransferase family protein [Halopolyspora algeriensis]RCW45725.1 hypothetical protein DFQ14_10226 [Halopolyspora algeriensis]TQM54109.1 hypothetical protein FHU43_2288 [Halopolyspora algeriensis]